MYKCNNLVVEDLNVKNGQQIHVQFQNSANVRVSGLTVTAPEDSPNTDGIHVTNTQNIQISNSIIGTGILNLFDISHILPLRKIKINKKKN